MKNLFRSCSMILLLVLLTSCVGVDNRGTSNNTIISIQNYLSSELYLVTEENKILAFTVLGPGAAYIHLEGGVNLNNAKTVEEIADVSSLSYTSGHYSDQLYFYIIKTDGNVWKITEDPETDKFKTQKVQGIENCIMIHCGSGHAIALTEEGSVFTWGDNACGQLGDGTNESRETPSKKNIKDFKIKR